ncbi:MAG: type VI secretion lipoprotein TssJ [Desulfobacterales bacterium]|nr:type VI secretion lipoprotein TssJ [Desulfobacterales bacterium]
MKCCICRLTVLLLVAVSLSCASSPSKGRQLNCPRKADAIQLVLRADPQLHFSNNVPHTVFICIYQLKDPNAFNLKTKYTEGLYELLDCSSFDSSVTDLERIVVYPNKDLPLTMDRAEGTNYIALAAGYTNMEKDRIVRIHEIPIDEKTKILTPWKKYYVCRDLNLEISLGPEQIETIEDLK